MSSGIVTGQTPRILLGMMFALAAADAALLSVHHFQIDWLAYARYLAGAGALAAGGSFYSTLRKDERPAAMLFGTSFLIAFSCLASLTNYLLLIFAGARTDAFFMNVDIAMGVDWPAMIAWASRHPSINLVLYFAYLSVLSQIALLIPLLGWQAPVRKIYAFCLAIAFASILAVGFWAFFPSMGPFSIYELPPSLIAHMPLAVGPDHEKQIALLLANGPGFITPGDIKGLIAFPSFHAVMAVTVAWYALNLKFLRWPVLALNLVVLISLPIQGSHYVIDVVGGLIVAAISIVAAEKLTAFAAARRSEGIAPIFSQADTTA